MANEHVVRVGYPETGATVTCAIYIGSSLLIRDSQTVESLLEVTANSTVYSNAGAVTIEAGDVVAFAVSGVVFGYAEYQPSVAVADKTGFKLASDGADLLEVSSGTLLDILKSVALDRV